MPAIFSFRKAGLTAVFFLFILTSCNYRARQEPERINPDSNYFSIHLFVRDQYDIYYGQPFTLNQITTLNGKRDSAVVNFNTMDWGMILSAFFAADIGYPKFLGHYRSELIDDPLTGIRTRTYEARDPDLFTRRIDINVDPANNRIQSVYIETVKKEHGVNKQQKLLYIPLNLIQIQEDDSGVPDSAKSLRIEYQFLS